MDTAPAITSEQLARRLRSSATRPRRSSLLVRFGIPIACLSQLALGCGGGSPSSQPTSVVAGGEICQEPVVPEVEPSDPEELSELVAAAFCSSLQLTTSEGAGESTVARTAQAACIGGHLVDSLGVDRVRELGLARRSWHLLGFALINNGGDNQIHAEEAESMVAVFEQCSKSWKQLLIRSATEGTELISDASAECVGGELSDDQARQILVGEIDRPYDDPARPDAVTYPDLIAPLIAAYDACLTAPERSGLDFN